MSKTLIIIAAGDASRMGYSPKAAALVNNKPNLLNTVEKAESYFNRIIVFSNEKYEELYKNIVGNLAEVLVIKSGRGCGHAVMKSIDNLPSSDREIVMCWGDVYVNDGLIFEEILNYDMEYSPLLIPVQLEKNPYVWFKNTEMIASCAMFSKKGEVIDEGYHDQSIFRFNSNFIGDSLHTMDMVLNRDGLYSNGEMRFLDIVHFFYNMDHSARLYETKYPTLSYNTETELSLINDMFKTKADA